MEGFYREIEVVTEQIAGKLPRFPGFQLTSDIAEKIKTSLQALKNGDLTKAFSILDGAVVHFRCKQAAYARTILLKTLEEEFTRAIQANLPSLLVQRIGADIDQYKVLVGQKFFDLIQGSKKYWEVRETIDAVYRENGCRLQQQEEKKRNQAQKAIQVQEEQQRLHLERCKQDADELLNKLVQVPE